MATTKSKIKFNKVRNKGEKLKAKIKNEKENKKKKNNNTKVKNDTNKIKNTKKQTETKPKKKIRIWYWLLIFATIIAIFVIIAIVGFGYYIVKNAPSFDEDLLFNKDSSMIYDKDGEIIATLGMNVGEDNVEKRVKLNYEDLPQVLIDAVIATEDSRFFQHNGVDLARFLKASIGQVLGQSDAGGASTLTMQVSKNALTSTTSQGIEGIIRKFTDIYLSVFKIEKTYTKQDIFELYVNSEFLGNQSYGVEQASQTYFGKSASDLTLSEAALIAGLFQAPSAYDPYVYPEQAKARRNQVLNLMLRHGYISEEQCEIAKNMPITEMLIKRTDNANPYQGYIDTVIEEVIDKYDVNPYKVPIEIYTNFDKNKQQVINSIYNGAYGYEFKDDIVQLAIAVIDNDTGALVAVGSGRNRNGEATFNYATMINRHPGSTIKPILDYGPAIEYLNYSTYTPMFDEPVEYTSGGTMKNWNNTYSGLVTMKTALSKSMNTTALQTFQATTSEQKWDFATSLGITPPGERTNIYEAASIGAFEGVNPVQLASAYSAFANGGYFVEAYTVKKIIYKESKDEYTYTENKNYTKKERVMKETTAWMITNILFDVTPSVAQVSGQQIATKTGTSSYDEDTLASLGLTRNVIQDSWVATYNPNYTIAFWYGYDELSKDNYLTMSATTTQRNKIQSMLTKNIFTSGEKFEKPSGITAVKVELETIPAALPSEYTPSDIIQTHYFISGTEPTETSFRYTKLKDPTKVKVVETGTSATITWNSPGIPDAANETFLREYFTKGYGQFAEKYLQNRLNYNTNAMGPFGFDIYLKSGSSLTYVGTTTDTKYTIHNTTNYDAVVIKSAYAYFKNNQSTGVTVNLTGDTTEIKIVIEGVKVGDEIMVNPSYNIGDEIPSVGLETIKFLVDGIDKTDSLSPSDMSYKISECNTTCTTVSKIDNSKSGSYEITYTVSYLGTTYKEKRYVYIKE